MTALKFAEGSYDVGDYARQETLGLYPEAVEQKGRSPIVLRKTGGLSSFASVGTGPIRGTQLLSDLLYAVSGGSLFSVTLGGVATNLGAIAGTGTVGMAVNGKPELMIVNGTTTGYVYDTTNNLRTITDADFLGGDVVHQLDTYFIVNVPGTNEFRISTGDDGFTWSGTDFGSKEGTPLVIVSLIPNHRDLILLGSRTLEFWRNTGNTDFTFERQEGTFQERGCGATHSVASLDNTVYFLGDDRIVYRIDGQIPTRISNHFIESKLEGYADVSSATAFTWTERGHYFYALNIEDDTWVYDATFSNQTERNTWHQRRTGIGSGRWRAENYIRAYNKHLLGDRTTGTIWELDPATLTDDGAEIQRRRTFNPIPPTERPVAINRLDLELEAGQNDSEVWLEVSKDGGNSFGNRIIRSAGAVGDRKTMLTWRRLGRARGKDWVLSLNATDADGGTWTEAYADMEVGVG